MDRIDCSDVFKNLVKSIVIILASTVVGTIFLCMVSFIPQKAIYNNTKVSVRVLCDEGIGTDVLGLRGSYLDIFTDGLMLNTVFYSAGDIRKTLLATRLSGETEDALIPIQSFFEDGYIEKTVDYTRYWHGYLVILRPLLCFGNIISIRALSFITMVTLVATICYLLYSRWNKLNLVVPFIVLWLSTSPVAVFSSLQYYSVFYPTLLAMIAILLTKELTIWKMWRVFLLLGIMIGYLDLLTFPVYSVGIPMILYISVSSNANKKIFVCIQEILYYLLAWCIGYSGMLISRWAIASVVSGNNVFIEGINQILYRTSHNYSGVKYTLLGTLKCNVHELGNQLTVFAVIFGCMVLVINIRKIQRKINWMAVISIILVCTFPFGWYFIVMQHSNMHYFMTYRNLCVVIYGFMSMLYVHLDFSKRK